MSRTAQRKAEPQPEETPAVTPEPVMIDFGRYRVLEDHTGTWWIYRAIGICGTCQGCGCGQQQQPLPLDSTVSQFLKARVMGEPVTKAELMKLLTGAMSMMGKMPRG